MVCSVDPGCAQQLPVGSGVISRIIIAVLCSNALINTNLHFLWHVKVFDVGFLNECSDQECVLHTDHILRSLELYCITWACCASSGRRHFQLQLMSVMTVFTIPTADEFTLPTDDLCCLSCDIILQHMTSFYNPTSNRY